MCKSGQVTALPVIFCINIFVGFSGGGLLVEPVKYIFDKLVKNYADYDNLIFENVALSRCPRDKGFLPLEENR